tara:strand:- start:170 stop:280 length:111 start_codon:yes stop_codon:yes gene_type:complete
MFIININQQKNVSPQILLKKVKIEEKACGNPEQKGY